jgi:hypothetical protein
MPFISFLVFNIPFVELLWGDFPPFYSRFYKVIMREAQMLLMKEKYKCNSGG